MTQYYKGSGKGTLYLHEESQSRVIDQDVKASSGLLDTDMNPKVADFKICC